MYVCTYIHIFRNPWHRQLLGFNCRVRMRVTYLTKCVETANIRPVVGIVIKHTSGKSIHRMHVSDHSTFVPGHVAFNVSGKEAKPRQITWPRHIENFVFRILLCTYIYVCIHTCTVVGSTYKPYYTLS